MPHKNTDLTVDGKLNPEKIIKKDPMMKEILNVGATWTWVPRRILLKYKGLDQIAQSAGNYINNCSKAEHDGQMLLKIAGKIDAGKEYEAIHTDIMKNRPKHVESIPGMYQFLRKHGGGKGMKLAKQMCYFLRGETDTTRKVTADVWDALGLDFKGQNQLTMLRHAIMLLLYTDENPKIATVSEIKSLVSKDLASTAADAETVIQELQDAIAGSAHSSTPEVLAEFSRFMVLVVSWLLKKKNATCIKQFLKTFDVELEKLTLNNLQWYFARQLANETNIQLGPTGLSEFELKLHPNKSVDQAEGASSINQVRDVTADNTQHILRDAGWKINDVVSHKDQPKENWIITKIGQGQVHLDYVPDLLDDDTAKTAGGKKSESSKKRAAPMVEFQTKVWKKQKVTETSVVPDDAPALEETSDYQLNLIKACAVIALNEALGKSEGTENLQLRLKPKCVVASDSIAKGKVHLVPTSIRISVQEKAKCSVGCETYSNGSLFLGTFQLSGKQYYMFAGGAQSSVPKGNHDGLKAPFWALDVTHKVSEANCALSLDLQNLKINVSKIDSWMQGGCTADAIMKIPAIVSTKALSKGEKLKVFVPSKKK